MGVLGHRESRFGISVSSDGGRRVGSCFFSFFLGTAWGGDIIGMPLDLLSAQRYHSIASFVGGSPLESDKIRGIIPHGQGKFAVCWSLMAALYTSIMGIQVTYD